MTPAGPARYPLHARIERHVALAPEAAFACLDDHRTPARHMTRRDWRMLGSRIEVDVPPGRAAIGQRMRLHGRIVGLRVFADEVVTEHDPPRHKAWETIGEVRLLAIGPYRMWLDVAPEGDGSRIALGIDYAMPERAPWRWLGSLFGARYVDWCLRMMLDDSVFAAGR